MDVEACIVRDSSDDGIVCNPHVHVLGGVSSQRRRWRGKNKGGCGDKSPSIQHGVPPILLLTKLLLKGQRLAKERRSVTADYQLDRTSSAVGERLSFELSRDAARETRASQQVP